MRIVDTEIPSLFGRTPRELVIIAGGLAICVLEVARTGTNPWHLLFYITATTLFALRFFAARVVGMGLMVSGLGLSLISLRYGVGWGDKALWWGFWAMLPGMVLLMSSDLRERFDRGSGLGWRLNRWRELPRMHWLASCWICYLLGLVGNMILLPWWLTEYSVSWVPVLLLAMFGTVILFFMGRSIAFLAAAVIAAVVFFMVLPSVEAAEAYTANALAAPPADPLWTLRPAYPLPAVIGSALIGALALPYAVLHVLRSLRGQPG